MRFYQIRRIGFLLVAFMCAMNAQAASGLSIEYEGLDLEKADELEALSHPLLLSAPKRVNNKLRIDRQVQLKGTKYSYLYSVKPGYDIDQAAVFYLESIRNNGSLEFRCEKRNCGASNDWANKIFGISKLAGRDSNQEYFAGTIDIAGLHGWLSVYAVTNGRREPYLYVTYIPVSEDDVIQAVRDGVLLIDGRLQSDQAALLSKHLDSSASARLVLIGFNKDANLSFKENLDRSQSRVESVAEHLINSLGIDASRLELKAMGELGQRPLTEEGVAWLYLYLVNES